jgi:hypothetical protein
MYARLGFEKQKSVLVSCAEMDSVRRLPNLNHLGASSPNFSTTSISEHCSKICLWRINSRQKLPLFHAHNSQPWLL